MYFGFRDDEGYAAALDTYTDFYAVGTGKLADSTTGNDWHIQTDLNDAGISATDIAETNISDNQVHTVTILVSGAGVVTSEIEGANVSDAPTYTFDDTDVLVPFFKMLQQEASEAAIDIVFWEIGLQ